MIRSSIDIGSNSVLLLVGKFERDGTFIEHLNLSEVTGLGSGLDKTKAFSEESMIATRKVLEGYREHIIKLNLDPKKTLVTATEASRVAVNAKEFYQKIDKDLGFETKIISAEGESYYSALGVYLGLLKNDMSEVTIMDLGGASTEIIKVKVGNFSVKDFISLPIGAVRGKEWMDRGDLMQKIQEVISFSSVKLNNFLTSRIVCIAGTMTSIANIFLKRETYSDKIVHGTVMQIGDFNHLLKKIGDASDKELSEKFPFLGKRSRTLYSGGMIAYEIGRFLKVNEFEISVYGARYGTLFEGRIKDEFVIGG